MAFKKFKLQKKKEVEVQKQLPKTKDLKVPKTHINRSLIDTVTILLYTKQNTGLRKILEMDTQNLTKNLYMITSKVLELCLQDNFSNELCFKVLKKILKNESKECLYNLMFKYLEVSILSNRDYKKYLEICFDHCEFMILENKSRLISILEDINFKRRVFNLKEKKVYFKMDDTIIFVNDKFVLN